MVHQSIFHYTVERFLETYEFRTGEKCEEGKSMVCGFHSNVHREVRESEEEGVCDAIACCRGYVRFVGGENYTEERSAFRES